MIPDEYLPILADKAREAARHWPDIDPGDILGELSVRWIQSWNRETGTTIRTYVEQADEKKLHKTLTNWANGYCRRETAAIRGHDDYTPYRREALKEMLPLLHDLEAWSSLAVPASAGARKLASEGSDALAVHADLTTAFDRLSPRDKQLLVWRYVDQLENWNWVAAIWLGVEMNAARAATSRALSRLEANMAGRPKAEGPVRRQAMSNAKAQALTDGGY